MTDTRARCSALVKQLRTAYTRGPRRANFEIAQSTAAAKFVAKLLPGDYRCGGYILQHRVIK